MKENTFLAKKDIETMNMDKLDESRKSQIIAIKDSIAFEYENTLDYASAASKNLTSFSSELLKSVKVRETPEVEGLITDLMSGMEKVDIETLTEAKPSFLKKLFKIDEIKQFIAKYDDVDSVIQNVKAKLESAVFQLRKDIEICDRHLERNLTYINELDNYIMAGMLRLKEAQEDLEKDKAELDTSDVLAVHTFDAKRKEVERFERKLHDLVLKRTIAVQNIPQIVLIKDGDSTLIEKIETSIESAIPLWESQMVIAIQIMRQRGALSLQKTVTDTTNRMLAQNSEMLKVGTVEIAKELENGIVDVETLKKTSDDLIKTLQDIRTIREQGREKRLKATQELAALQVKLNQQLLTESKVSPIALPNGK